MKRVPIQRKVPLRNRAAPPAIKRRRRAPVKQVIGCAGVVRQASAVARPVPKEAVIAEHEAYMALVRRMRCGYCGWPPPSQFCHADMNKGAGLKTDCRRGYPGCGPRIVNGVHEPGCHYLIGTSGRIPKQERRELEERLGRETREEIFAQGQWPKRLPLFNPKE